MIGEYAMGLLVSPGVQKVDIFALYTMAVLSTRDELVDATRQGDLQAGHVCDANRVMVKAMIVRVLGANAAAYTVDHGIVRDDVHPIGTGLTNGRRCKMGCKNYITRSHVHPYRQHALPLPHQALHREASNQKPRSPLTNGFHRRRRRLECVECFRSAFCATYMSMNRCQALNITCTCTGDIYRTMIDSGVDVLECSGGVSIDTADCIKPALRLHDATIHMERVLMKPGKPLASFAL